MPGEVSAPVGYITLFQLLSIPGMESEVCQCCAGCESSYIYSSIFLWIRLLLQYISILLNYFRSNTECTSTSEPGFVWHSYDLMVVLRAILKIFCKWYKNIKCIFSYIYQPNFATPQNISKFFLSFRAAALFWWLDFLK